MTLPAGAAPSPPPTTAASCTLPELLGLCKLRPSGGQTAAAAAPPPLLVLLASEAVADLVLWLLLRLHAKLLRTDIYREVRGRRWRTWCLVGT